MVSTEQIVDLIVRGEQHGWLSLSEVEQLGNELPQEPLEALYARLDAHGIEVRDDCRRTVAARADASGRLVAATATALWLFRDEILPFPPLTADEDLELALGVERGDRRSKERMISSNLRLVVSVAKRYEGRGLMVIDLIQEGVLALDRAVDTFDWRRGYRFATYATWCIHQAMRRFDQALRRHEALVEAIPRQRELAA